METKATIDLLIIGAGMHGIAMAKTYLQVYPEASILVIDQAKSIGGSWAKERLYPGLKTNNVIGSYEFSDYPMTPEQYGVQPGAHIPGEVVHQYFCDVAKHYDIESRIQYQTIAESAKLQKDGTWEMHLLSTDDSTRGVIIARKLVVATGLTSTPRIPNIPGSETFGGLILHSKQLKECAKNLASCTNVVVLGGNKSAWDVCYNAAQSGSKVHMVIRPSGGGPSYLWPKSFSFGSFKTSLAALSSSRFFTLFDPTPFGQSGPLSFVRKWLHGTVLGAKLVNFFWTTLDATVRRANGFHKHPEIKKLEPWTTPFWLGNSLSIHNYASDWFQLVREGKISVHIAEVNRLSETSVYLSDGQCLDADTLVCCTGWKSEPSVPIYINDTLTNIMHPKVSDNTSHDIARAETEILDDIPYLRNLPRRTPNAPALSQVPNTVSTPTSTPHQLYRLLIPWQEEHISLHNLAFIGAHSSPHALIVAQAQALWVTAYFSSKIPHLNSSSTIDHDAIRYEAIKHSVYGRIRRPKETGGAGDKFPDLVFDSLAYVDVLLGDLGIRRMRKGGFWGEWWGRYGVGDYRGLVEEWVAMEKGREEGSECID